MNKKNILKTLSILLLALFSFYYTNKATDLVRQIDPLMKQIKNNESKFITAASNAKIVGNKIIPGKKGKKVNYNKTYTKMKKYGSYNEALTVFEEIKPEISIENNYSKYIEIANKENALSLIFKIKKDTKINKIEEILNKTNTKATFFIDGTFLEKNTDTIINLNNKNHQLEILSYDNKYQESFFTSSIKYLNSITKRKSKFCFTDIPNKELLNMCKKQKLHTVLPTYKVNKRLYQELKKEHSSGMIILIPVNSNTENELYLTINYLKQRGYSFFTLEDLLNE